MKKSFITYIILCFACLSCDKTFVLTDPQTGQEPIQLSTSTNDTCKIADIKQINGDIEYNRLSYQLNINNQISGLTYYDNVTKSIDYKISFQYFGDTIVIDNYSWMLKDPTTQNIIKYFVKDTSSNPNGDNITYTYQYNSNDRLVSKFTYFNQTKTPDYITNYIYSGDNLISSTLFIKDGKTMILKSDYNYDISKIIKPWIYLFGDAFENYKFLQGLQFGIKAKNPISQINTQIFDANNGKIIDEWKTTFSGYVFSKDNYVLQVTSNGDFQQGLGLFTGTTRFEYSCK